MELLIPIWSMMLVPTGPLDVVPARRLMTLVTLLDSGVRFTGNGR